MIDQIKVEKSKIKNSRGKLLRERRERDQDRCDSKPQWRMNWKESNAFIVKQERAEREQRRTSGTSHQSDSRARNGHGGVSRANARQATAVTWTTFTARRTSLHAQIKCIFNAPPFDQVARRRTKRKTESIQGQTKENTKKRRKTIKPTSEERAGNADKGDVIGVWDRGVEFEKESWVGERWLEGGAGGMGQDRTDCESQKQSPLR